MQRIPFSFISTKLIHFQDHIECMPAHACVFAHDPRHKINRHTNKKKYIIRYTIRTQKSNKREWKIFLRHTNNVSLFILFPSFHSFVFIFFLCFYHLMAFFPVFYAFFISLLPKPFHLPSFWIFAHLFSIALL